MGNMSYCRFEKTSGDLIDCREAIENGEMSVEMSQHERDGLEILLDACEEIYHLKDDIEDALKRWDDHDEEMKREEEEAQKRWEEEEQAKKPPQQLEAEKNTDDFAELIDKLCEHLGGTSFKRKGLFRHDKKAWTNKLI